MRSRRRTPAGGVQAEKQRRYVQLIAQGVGNSEACRLVGIDRKTGNRWRYGRKVRNSAGALVIYPPVKVNEARPRSPRYLSEQERIGIADLLAAKMSVRGIAAELGRAPSTISREIRRNSDPDGRLPACITPSYAASLPAVASTPRKQPGRRRRGCSPRSSSGCWRSAGARSRSRTSCGCCSPSSRRAGCARRRSTRRSMTLRSRSHGQRGVGAAVGGCSACSAVGG